MKRILLIALAPLLIAPLMLNAQGFGGALTVSGENVIIGETGNGLLPGTVYVYSRTGSAWQEVAQLTAADSDGAPDGFGQGLASDGETLLIGSPNRFDGPGAVFVFAKNGSGAWSQVGRFSANDGMEGDGFGAALAISGDVALISATGANDGAGAVYAFSRSGDGSWGQVGKASGSDAASGDNFGATVAFDGSVALVGAPGGRGAPGAAYAFQYGSGGLVETGKIQVDGSSGLGASLGLNSDMAVVGAPSTGQRVGSVFGFEYNTQTASWERMESLVPFDSPQNGQFGSSIAFDGTTIWVGAPGVGSSGAFYLFERDDIGHLVGATKLASSMLADGAGFGGALVIEGDVAAIGATGLAGGSGAAVMFERGGESWAERNSVVSEWKSLDAIAGEDVECEEDVAAGFECSDVDIVSFVPIKDLGGSRGTRVNDIWGWTDPQTDKEYAIIGRTDGTSFVDLSNPSQPVYVGDLPMTPGSQTSIWRDMKVYKDHAYIVADAANQHGIQVFDLTRLRDRSTVPATYESDFIYDGIASAHNIVINEESGFGYAVGSSSGGETCGGGLHMVNLETPSRPEFAGCFADPSTGRSGTGYSHDAQCVMYSGPDEEYQGKEICMSSNETALSIADVTDKANPIGISTATYPNVAYTHQGWLTEDQRYFYLNDEGDEPAGTVAGTRTLVWDVTDLDDPILVNEHIAETTTTDHNLYVRGDTMYQSNYGSGLRILDISDPVNPTEVGFIDTTPYGGGGSWSNYPYFKSGIIIMTSMSEGLFVVKARPRNRLIS